MVMASLNSNSCADLNGRGVYRRFGGHVIEPVYIDGDVALYKSVSQAIRNSHNYIVKCHSGYQSTFNVMGDPNLQFYIFCQGKLRGMAGCNYVRGKHLYIETFETDPAYRRQGWGERFCAYIQRWAVEFGEVRWLTLS